MEKIFLLIILLITIQQSSAQEDFTDKYPFYEDYEAFVAEYGIDIRMSMEPYDMGNAAHLDAIVDTLSLLPEILLHALGDNNLAVIIERADEETSHLMNITGGARGGEYYDPWVDPITHSVLRRGGDHERILYLLDDYPGQTDQTAIKMVLAYFTLHEIAHGIDYLKYNHFPRVQKRSVEENQRNSIFDCSYFAPLELPFNMGKDWSNDGLSSYSCTNKWEDFAEHFAFYIIDPDNFCNKAKTLDKLSKKYQFLRTYIFEDAEFSDNSCELPEIDFKAEKGGRGGCFAGEGSDHLWLFLLLPLLLVAFILKKRNAL